MSIITPKSTGIGMRGISVLFFLLANGPALAQEATDARAQHLYENACSQCHGLQLMEQVTDGRAGWEDVIQNMVIEGAQLNNEEMDLVVDYLAARHGPGSGAMKTGPLPPGSVIPGDRSLNSEDIVLPPGEGETLVEGYCRMCHDLGRIVSARRDRDSWELYTREMLARGNLEVPAEQIQKMTNYLTEHLGR